MSNRRMLSRAGKGWLSSITAVVATVALAAGGLLVVAAPAAADDNPAPGVPATVTADALPTAQIDGVVWAQAVAGNTVYVGGEFANARPAGAAAGQNTSPRANLMAYDLTTGNLLPWNPGANASVKTMTVSPDGSTLYVGGTFTQIAGQARYRVAAFDAATGALLPWTPGPNAGVNGVVTDGTTVWLAGWFTSVNSNARPGVAAVDAKTAAVLPFTANVQGGSLAKGIVLSPDDSKVVIAGSFTSVNGSTSPGRGMAALDSRTGASLPWAGNSVLRNGGDYAAMQSIASDSDSVYVTGYDFGGSKTEDDFEGAARLNWSDGSIVWMEDCHGDTYGVAPVGDVIYTVSHTHYCGTIGGFPQTSPTWTLHHALAWDKAYNGAIINGDSLGYRSFAGEPAGTQLHWYPDFQVGTYTGLSQAAWTVTSAKGYVLMGGEFPKVSGKAQQGLVRFATKAIVGQPKIGPAIPSSSWPLSGYSIRTGEVRLSWGANWDRDNQSLTYQLYRSGTAAPLYTTTANSNFWTLPQLNYTDSTATPGQTYKYRVVATDPDGNSVTGAWTSFTAASSNLTSSYDDAVLNDGAVHYWPLGDSSTTSATDWAGQGNLTLSNPTPGQTGPNLAQADSAMSFNGSNTSYGSTSVIENGPNQFTLEAWFKTTSTSGGKIIGFGDSFSGNSSSYDRQIYLGNDGTVTYGVYPGGVRSISSAPGFNDGAWHYVAASLGASGMQLYIDGKLIGARTDTTSAQAYSGYWRVGGDNLNGWPNVGSSSYLNGTIANVAVYNTVLSRTTVDQHWVDSGRPSTIPPAPSDSYGSAVYKLDPTLYWRLDDSATGTAADSGMNGNSGTYYGNVTSTTGALAGNPDAAAAMMPAGGTQTGVSSNSSFSDPEIFSLEAWFNTTTTAGGKILGFGNSQTGTSSSYDRHIYMATDGTVKFGIWNGAAQIVQSAPGYNDGKWHHVVAELSSAGMSLYLDGQLVASNPSATQAQPYTGYWRVGGDSGWEGATYWQGSADEVAVYPQVLSASQVLTHYQLGMGAAVNQPPTASFGATVNNLSVAFDGTQSSDPDGTIASYAWDFGDGATSTQAQPTHVYANAGSFNVTLTVTDNKGATGTVTHQVTTTAANTPPTAAFGSTVNGLTVSLDGSASSDPDGSVASYAWAYGDGQTGVGATSSHTYGSAGTYNVTLTVTDNQGATGSVTHQVTVAAANQSPVAAFTSAASGLAVAFDGSGSSDPDGSVASYAWDFGDGGTSAVVKPSHTYGSAGTYNVTLTVTDNQGATGSVTHQVTVAAPASGVLAQDGFGRTVTGGWGTADVGGPWSVVGSASQFSVSNGAGAIKLTSSAWQEADLASVSSANSLLSATFKVDKVAQAHYVQVIGRQIGSQQYALRARIASDGSVSLYVLRSGTAVGAAYTVPGLTVAAGTAYTLKFQVVGTSPTTLSAKMWPAAGTEPAAWQLTRTDTTAALQAAGSVGLSTWLGTSANAYPLVVSFSAFSATDPTA